MTLAARADAATTRDALAAAARLMGLCGDLRGLQPELTPEPTRGAEDASGHESETNDD